MPNLTFLLSVSSKFSPPLILTPDPMPLPLPPDPPQAIWAEILFPFLLWGLSLSCYVPL